MNNNERKGKESMKNLGITLDSREVAAMVDKEHSKLLRDIRTYIVQMEEANKMAFEEGRGNESKIGLADFFRESSYKDAKGESRPCYQVTKKGCEFIAHKMTGVKGTEFTARYISRFHDMEAALGADRNIYKVRGTSLGEVTSFVREMDRVMRDQNSHPSDIAEAFRGICEQFGIRLPDTFVREPLAVEPAHFLPLEAIMGS